MIRALAGGVVRLAVSVLVALLFAVLVGIVITEFGQDLVAQLGAM